MSDEENSKKKLSRRFILGASAALAASCSGLSKKPASRNPSSPWDHIFGKPKQKPGSIGKRPEDLKSEYDVVIIGSGYGASVLAARLCENNRNLNVCILERGKEYHPGDLPETMGDLTMKNTLDPSGLLEHNMSMSSDLDVVCASGLGGTSLINAAISIRPEPIVFKQKEWPKEIQNLVNGNEVEHLGGLEKYFQLAARSLEANSNTDKLSSLPKSKRIQSYFRNEGITHGFLSLAIKYNSEESYGLDRDACTHCGNCTSGCNVGAKNILPYNYLSHAHTHGCNIFIQAEVSKIKKKGDKYEISVKKYKGRFPGGSKKIKAKYVILGAGSLGSTRILLKSQSKSLKFSKKLGSRVSLNGDVLGFSYNGDKKTNTVGFGTSLRRKLFNGDVGPSITTFGNYRLHPRQNTMHDRFLLLEGTIPGPLVNIVAYGLALHAKTNKNDFNFSKEQWKRVNKDFGKGPLTKPLDPNGALNHSTLFLACGHDSGSGKYRLSRFGNISVKWKGVGKERYFTAITNEMKKAAEYFGGVYMDNPRTSVFKGKMMATHPLGGCPMGDNKNSGVVDHFGRVFNRNGGLHSGLYVVDGAIVPRSLGATPLLTITALAERIAEHLNNVIKV